MKSSHHKIFVADEDNIRIDRWLRRKFSRLPQSFFEKKLRKGFIRLNKRIIKANTKGLSGVID